MEGWILAGLIVYFSVASAIAYFAGRYDAEFGAVDFVVFALLWPWTLIPMIALGAGHEAHKQEPER